MNKASDRRSTLAPALNRRGLAALFVGLAVLIAIVASSALQSISNSNALRRVAATQDASTVLQNILLAVLDAETGQRGFLLTGNDDYLSPFALATAALPRLQARLDLLLPDDPRLPALRASIAAKMSELQRTVGLMQDGDREGALAIVRTNAGRGEMQRLRAMTAELSLHLQALLAKASHAIERGGWLLIAIDLLAFVFLLAVAAIIGIGLRTYLALLAAARRGAAEAYAALSDAKDKLDETVLARTAGLTRANEEIQRFAYIVSHDLRAPLVNIMGFTGELELATGTLKAFAATATLPPGAHEAVTVDIPEALGFIRAATAKMDRLINAILKLSREGRRDLVVEQLDMTALVQDLVASMRHQAKGVSVTIGTLPRLRSDRLAIEQIFSNIIDNALKYRRPDVPGQITISATQAETGIDFAIADNGCGIAERDYERVFELFRRAGAQGVPGEGIGLAHVRALVQRLGGRITCRSTLGAGTTFTVSLPNGAGGISQPAAAIGEGALPT